MYTKTENCVLCEIANTQNYIADRIMHKRIPIMQKTVSNILMRFANQTLE